MVGTRAERNGQPHVQGQRGREFSRFVAERSSRLLLLARHLFGDPDLAGDLTQTVLEKVYLKWAKVSAAEEHYSYVRRMLVNAKTTGCAHSRGGRSPCCK